MGQTHLGRKQSPTNALMHSTFNKKTQDAATSSTLLQQFAQMKDDIPEIFENMAAKGLCLQKSYIKVITSRTEAVTWTPATTYHG